MLFLRKKITIAFLALAVVGGHLSADNADYVSRAQQKVRNARDWSAQVAKESYDKVREKAENAYASTCQKARALYEKAKEHKFMAGALAYLAVEGILKLSGNPTLFNRIFLLPTELGAANANNANLQNTINGHVNTINGHVNTIANLNTVVIPGLNNNLNAANINVRNLQNTNNAHAATIANLNTKHQQDQQELLERIGEIELERAFDNAGYQELINEKETTQEKYAFLKTQYTKLLDENKHLENRPDLEKQGFTIAMKNVGQQIDQLNARNENLSKAHQELRKKHTDDGLRALQDLAVLEELRQEVPQLRKQIADYKQQVAALTEQRDKIQQDMNAVGYQRDQKDVLLQDKQLQLDYLNEEIVAKNAQIQQKEVQINELIRNSAEAIAFKEKIEDQELQRKLDELAAFGKQALGVALAEQALLDQKYGTVVTVLDDIAEKLLAVQNNQYEIIDARFMVVTLLEQLQELLNCRQNVINNENIDQQTNLLNLNKAVDKVGELTQQTIDLALNQIQTYVGRKWFEDVVVDDDITEDNFNDNIQTFSFKVIQFFEELDETINRLECIVKQQNPIIESCWNKRNINSERSIFLSLDTMIRESSSEALQLLGNKSGNKFVVKSHQDKLTIFMHALVASQACYSYEKMCYLYPENSRQNCLDFVETVQDNWITPIVASLDNIEVNEDLNKPDNIIVAKNGQNILLESWMQFASKIDNSMLNSMFESKLDKSMSASVNANDLQSSSGISLDELMKLRDAKSKDEYAEINKMLESSIIGLKQSTAPNMNKSIVPNMTSSIFNKPNMTSGIFNKSLTLSNIIGKNSNLQQEKSDLTLSKLSPFTFEPLYNKWDHVASAINANITNNRHNGATSILPHFGGINQNNNSISGMQSGLYDNNLNSSDMNASKIIAAEKENAEQAENDKPAAWLTEITAKESKSFFGSNS